MGGSTENHILEGGSPPPPPCRQNRERERERELESSGGNLSRSLFPIQSSEERLESGGWGTELGKVLLIGDTGERQLEGSGICTCVGGIGGHLLGSISVLLLHPFCTAF